MAKERGLIKLNFQEIKGETIFRKKWKVYFYENFIQKWKECIPFYQNFNQK